MAEHTPAGEYVDPNGVRFVWENPIFPDDQVGENCLNHYAAELPRCMKGLQWLVTGEVEGERTVLLRAECSGADSSGNCEMQVAQVQTSADGLE